MKKIFLVAGEVSGDRIAGWYIKKMLAPTSCQIEGIGGDVAIAAGMKAYERFEGLNVVGIVELLRHIPRLLAKIQELAAYILANEFDEVILIDFPGFNLRLARLLKKRSPGLRIIYVSPPQLWAWGGWRLKRLKQVADEVVVMYPFEVAWYKERGLEVSWQGSPVVEGVAPYQSASLVKQPRIVLLPASRKSELEKLWPLFLAVAVRLSAMHPGLSFVVPMPQSLTIGDYEAVAARHGYSAIPAFLTFVADEHEKFIAFQQACLALAKPGTVTLELGLLRVPTVVIFKTSWLSYLLGRLVVKVTHMSLPNLLTQQILCKELIQNVCTLENIVTEADAIVHQFLFKPGQYEQKLRSFEALDKVLCQSKTLC